MTVVVLEHSGLFPLFLVTCEQHGGILRQVLVEGENQNYDDEMM